MKPNFKETMKKVRLITLSSQEKEQMWQHITKRISGGPLVNLVNLSTQDHAHKTRTLWEKLAQKTLQGVRRPTYALAGIVAIVILVTGSGAYAAEQSLPGDLLYPLKVNVIEPAQGFFNFSPQAQAAWDIQLANNRLAEIEKLAAQGKLTTAIQSAASARLTNTISNAQERLQTMQQEKNTAPAAGALASDLEVSLKAHALVLQKISDIQNNNHGLVENIIQNIRTHEQKVTTMQNQDTAESAILFQATSSPQTPFTDTQQRTSVEQEATRARDAIMHAQSYIKEYQTEAQATTTDDAYTHIQSAQEHANNGVAHEKSGQYKEAFSDFQDAAESAQNAQAAALSQHLLKINAGIDIPQTNNQNINTENNTATPLPQTNNGQHHKGDAGRPEKTQASSPADVPTQTILPSLSPKTDMLNPSSPEQNDDH